MSKTLEKVIVDLLLFQVLFWIVVLIFSYVSGATTSPFILIMMGVNSFLFAVASYVFSFAKKVFDYSVLGFVFANIVLTFNDGFTGWDWVSLIINIVLFFFIIWYIFEEQKNKGSLFGFLFFFNPF